MKRPFALFGSAAFAASALAVLVGGGGAAVLAAICAGLGFCALFSALFCRFKLSAHPGARAFFLGGIFAALTLLIAAACLFHFFLSWNNKVEPVSALNGKTARVRAVVLDYPEQRYHKYYYRLAVKSLSVDGETAGLPEFTARVSTWTSFSWSPYDTVECGVTFSLFDGGGLYSARGARLAEGVVIGGYLRDYEGINVIPAAGSSPGKLPVELRHRIARSFEQLLPKSEAGILRAVLLGEQWRIPEEVTEEFRAVGASHYLVISGLHMTAIAALLFLLLRRLPVGRKIQNLLVALGILGFLTLIGFPLSAMRSGLMFLLYLLADSLGRDADSVNSLGVAVLLICLGNPFAGGDLGFAMSVTSSLGILLWAESFRNLLLRPFARREKLKAALGFPAEALGVSFGALLGLLPIQILIFRGMSLLSPMSSLVLALPFALLLYCAALAAFLGLMPALLPAARVFVFVAGWMAKLATAVTRGMARWPGFFLDLARPLPLLILGLLLLIGALAFRFRKEKAVFSAALAAMVLLSGCGAGFSAVSERDLVTVAAAADSSCLVLMKDRRAVILSLGGYRTGAAREILRRNNVRQLELLCLPLRDADAGEAAVQTARAFPAEKIALPEDAYAGKDLLVSGGELLFWEDGETLTVLGGITIRSELGMERLTVDVNGLSLVVETGNSGRGSCQLLFTNQEDTEIKSAFTVLQKDDIIETMAGLSAAGKTADGILVPAGDGLYADLHPDGSISFRGESYG